MSKRIHNRLKYVARRKSLRSHLTSAEAYLWRYLKNKQLEGRKFRRQHGVGNYTLDFYCASEKLAIELDGAYHNYDEAIIYDERRTRYLNSLGIQVIRFENKVVFEDTEYVLTHIAKHFSTNIPADTVPKPSKL